MPVLRGTVVPFISNLSKRVPLVYALLLILLIPLTLVVNTLWNLRGFERDMHFAIREQGLLIANVVNSLTGFTPIGSDEYQQVLIQLQNDVPEIISISVLLPENNSFSPLIQTNPAFSTQDPTNFLNSLAWSEKRPFFTEVNDRNLQENMWVLVTPITTNDGQQVLLNVKISSSKVDAVITRSSRDGLIILTISVLFIVLLLINHLRFFEQSRMVDKLKEIDQMKDDFISVASHELRTPITALKGYLYLLEKDLTPIMTPQRKKKITNMIENTDRLGLLIEDILNISRIEQNRMDFTAEPLSATEQIQNVLSELAPSAEQKNLSLALTPSEGNITLFANKDRLRQILVNLIGNAIKYTPSGSVTVSVNNENGKAHILVKDTGIGIAPEEKAKLFAKFGRIQNENTKNINGTGLGLWISKSMAEKMGGDIFVDSVMGEGTVFTLVLPTSG